MIEINSSLNGLLILNSIVIIGFILNQNDSTKDNITQNSSSSTNPFETITWISVGLQFSLLLIKIKSNDF